MPDALVSAPRGRAARGTATRSGKNGYDATLVGDAHTTEDLSQWGLPVNAEQVIAFTNMYWSESSVPGRTARVVPTAEVDFAGAG